MTWNKKNDLTWKHSISLNWLSMFVFYMQAIWRKNLTGNLFHTRDNLVINFLFEIDYASDDSNWTNYWTSVNRCKTELTEQLKVGGSVKFHFMQKIIL